MLRLPQRLSKRFGWSSPGDPAPIVGGFAFLRGFRLSTLQLCLTQLCGLCGISSRLQCGFLEEVAPAFMPIRWVLFAFELLQGRLCIGSSLNDFDHSRGFVGADIVADDHIGSFEFVVCQTLSPGGLIERPYSESMR